MPYDRYRTPTAPFRHEIDPIKGSRFIADLAPVATAAEAEAFLARIAAEHDDARHHCFAWRLGPRGDPFRSGDAGEPSGSAGRPILLQLEGHELSDCVCVVTRWFGGTKLGVGGLMRAYGGAAGAACDRAPTRTVTVTLALAVEHPYASADAVQRLLARRRLLAEQAEYGETVRFVVRIPAAEIDALRRELADATAGRARVEAAPGG